MRWVQFSIRVPETEHEALKRASDKERRSLNQQACKLIADGLAELGYLPPAESKTAKALDHAD